MGEATTTTGTSAAAVSSNAFDAWLDALEVPTETISLCTDPSLVKRAAELRDRAKAESPNDGSPSSTSSLGDRTEVRELDEVRKEIEEKSLRLVVRSPSEDKMLAIESLRETDPEQFVVALIAAAVVTPKLTEAGVKKLRGRVDRGTWNDLFRRVLSVSVDRSLTLPFSWGDSGSDHT